MSILRRARRAIALAFYPALRPEMQELLSLRRKHQDLLDRYSQEVSRRKAYSRRLENLEAKELVVNEMHDLPDGIFHEVISFVASGGQPNMRAQKDLKDLSTAIDRYIYEQRKALASLQANRIDWGAE